MSHTTSFQDEQGEEWIATHDGFALTGKVWIKGPNGKFSIPAEVMLQFAAECVRSHRMSELENAGAPELLGLAPK